MKTGIFFLALAGFLLGSCANEPLEKIWVTGPSLVSPYHGPERPARQTLEIADKSYDRIWEACERSLIGFGFAFYASDKYTGEIRVRDPLQVSPYVGTAYVTEVQICVTRADDQISLTVSCTCYSGSELRLERQQNEVDRIVKAIKKRLKK